MTTTTETRRPPGADPEKAPEKARDKAPPRRRRAAGPADRTRTTPKTPKTAPTTTPRPARKTSGTPRKPAPAARRTGRSAPRAPFVLLVVGLLGGALVSLLLLNTVLAQDAFTLTELQRSNQQLNERKQALQEDIGRENSPAVLHAKARSLGMVDGKRPAFIDARTGRVTEGGTRPPGVSNQTMAAAAGAGVVGAPGAIMPPTGGDAPHSAPDNAPDNGKTGGGTR
jgi:hypothetical protein